MKKIEVLDPLEFSLFKKDTIDINFISECEDKVYNFQMRKIIDNFEIFNFDEKVFFSVNEMFVKQMEKIEELTLYMIELKKELELLKKENKGLKLSIINTKQ